MVTNQDVWQTSLAFRVLENCQDVSHILLKIQMEKMPLFCKHAKAKLGPVSNKSRRESFERQTGDEKQNQMKTTLNIKGLVHITYLKVKVKVLRGRLEQNQMKATR